MGRLAEQREGLMNRGECDAGLFSGKAPPDCKGNENSKTAEKGLAGAES